MLYQEQQLIYRVNILIISCQKIGKKKTSQSPNIHTIQKKPNKNKQSLCKNIYILQMRFKKKVIFELLYTSSDQSLKALVCKWQAAGARCICLLKVVLDLNYTLQDI